jgi:hypothetical protein
MSADQMECKVVGIGTLTVKMFDGIVKTLGNVRRFYYSVRGGVIKVTKGVLVVMKREKAFKNLYKLIGETVKGGA